MPASQTAALDDRLSRAGAFEHAWRQWFWLDDSLRRQFDYKPAHAPRALAKTHAKRIAEAGEAEAGPIEEALYRIYAATMPIRCEEIVRLLDSLEIFPGFPTMHVEGFTLEAFSSWIVDAALRGRMARDRGVPPMPIFAFMKTASAFLTMTIARLADVPSGVLALTHCIGIRPWASFAARFPIAVHDHFCPSESNVRLLVEAGISKVVLHVRDPRQVVLSLAYHEDSAQPTRMIDPVIRDVIPLYRDWLMCWLTRACRGGIQVRLTTYESLAENEASFAHAILEYFNAGTDLHERVAESVASVKKLTKQGQANFRTGTTDEWKDVLSKNQIAEIEKTCSGAFAGLYGF